MRIILLGGCLCAATMAAAGGCESHERYARHPRQETIVYAQPAAPAGVVVMQQPPPPAETAVVVQQPPPPVVVETRPVAPSVEFVWADGYWVRHRDRWVWVSGSWRRPPRHGAVWVPAHWERRGEEHHFVAGRWR